LRLSQFVVSLKKLRDPRAERARTNQRTRNRAPQKFLPSGNNRGRDSLPGCGLVFGWTLIPPTVRSRNQNSSRPHFSANFEQCYRDTNKKQISELSAQFCHVIVSLRQREKFFLKGETAVTKLTWLLAGILILAGSAHAQETPQAEVSASYSYLRIGGSGGTNQNGGSFSFAWNPDSWLGIVGDVGIYHSTVPLGGVNVGINTTTFAFGPRISARTDSKFTPFAQILLGGAHLSAGFNGITASTNGFAVIGGGGIDVQVARHIAVRPQIEYVGLRNKGGTSNAVRLSFGVVFQLGSR
jgi:outer membrane immunogenic protein